MEENKPIYEDGIIYIDGKKPAFNGTLQILIDKELKKEAQKVALDNDENLSEVIRMYLKSYVASGKRETRIEKADKPRKKLSKKKQSV